VTGLHPVRKRLKGGDRWYIYAWRGGPRIAIQDGERPTITLDLIRLAEQACDGRRGPATHTVSWLVESYRSSPQFTKREPSTRSDYNTSLDRIEAEWGDCDISLFDDTRVRADIDDWRNKWAHQPRTADKALVMLSTLLNWARRERGLVAINAAEGMALLHSVNKADEIWEERHWGAVATVKNFPAPLWNAIKLASMTGLRQSDLLGLQWSEVGEKAIITVTAKRKGRAVIPVFAELRAFLDAIKPDDAKGAVLRSSRGTQWTPDGLKTAVQRKMPAGFDRTFHDLRGTYVTWLAVKGLTDEQIARIVGWTAKRVGEVRARYVDEARVIVSLVDRLSA
jgi:integrase